MNCNGGSLYITITTNNATIIVLVVPLRGYSPCYDKKNSNVYVTLKQ
jgi:hypothetical protein